MNLNILLRESYIQDVMTVPANLVGIPALSIPVKVSSQSLPLGIQLMGKHLSDYHLLEVASRIVDT
jgi:aspartyl-tRNA(Asn)/glutamyl-tRNA(Gln) amidotransferase subunit A